MMQKICINLNVNSQSNTWWCRGNLYGGFLFYHYMTTVQWVNTKPRALPFKRNKFWPLFRELKEVMAINILCKIWRTVFDRTSQCFKARALLHVKKHSEVLNTCSEAERSALWDCCLKLNWTTGQLQTLKIPGDAIFIWDKAADSCQAERKGLKMHCHLTYF
jgi:hypothetical protein